MYHLWISKFEKVSKFLLLSTVRKNRGRLISMFSGFPGKVCSNLRSVRVASELWHEKHPNSLHAICLQAQSVWSRIPFHSFLIFILNISYHCHFYWWRSVSRMVGQPSIYRSIEWTSDHLFYCRVLAKNEGFQLSVTEICKCWNTQWCKRFNKHYQAAEHVRNLRENNFAF